MFNLNQPSAFDRLLTSPQTRSLFLVDCLGEIIPSLSTDWTKTTDGWRFTIDTESEISPAGIIDQWMSLPQASAAFDSIYSHDATSLTVVTTASHSYPPLLLGSHGFGVSLPLSDSSNGQQLAVKHDVFDLRGQDGRDALAGQVDLLFTRSREVIEFANAEPTLTAVPLPNDRVYIFVGAHYTELSEVDSNDGTPIDSVFAEHILAAPISAFENASEFVVTVAKHRYWWTSSKECRVTNREILPQVQDSSTTAHDENMRDDVAYLSDDDLGRSLSARFITLPSLALHDGSDLSLFVESIPNMMADADDLRTADLTRSQFGRSLIERDRFGYIGWLPTTSVRPCKDSATLVESAPWFASIDSLPFIPLVESQQFAIIRHDSVSVIVDYFGDLHILDNSASSNE